MKFSRRCKKSMKGTSSSMKIRSTVLINSKEMLSALFPDLKLSKGPCCYTRKVRLLFSVTLEMNLVN